MEAVKGWTLALALVAVASLPASVPVAAVAAAQEAKRCPVQDGDLQIPSGPVALREDGPDRPGQITQVSSFDIDRHEITNRQFAVFVAAVRYTTQAESQGWGAVFVAPSTPPDLNDPNQWWHLTKGADWRHPLGPGSNAAPDEPVVQVTFADAQAYARWAGRSLPTGAQWERAARGGVTRARDPMSWAYAGEKPLANTWQGVFPVRNTDDDGFVGLAPVGCFKPNGFGLYDMIGNVWEFTLEEGGDGHLVRGGSYLCARNYCANFRPAAWQAQEEDLPTSHIGFRTIARQMTDLPA